MNSWQWERKYIDLVYIDLVYRYDYKKITSETETEIMIWMEILGEALEQETVQYTELLTVLK